MPEGHEGEHRTDYEGLAKAFEEIDRMLEEQGITRLPKSPKDSTGTSPRTSKKWVCQQYRSHQRNVRQEFDEKLKLRIERQKQRQSAIEERRRKKLAQMYPSHSEDGGDPPDP